VSDRQDANLRMALSYTQATSSRGGIRPVEPEESMREIDSLGSRDSA